MEYSTLPPGVSSKVQTYKLYTPQDKLDELKTLIKAGKIASKTYESTHADTKNDKFGIEYDWIVHARDEWLKLDWYSPTPMDKISSQLLTNTVQEKDRRLH